MKSLIGHASALAEQLEAAGFVAKRSVLFVIALFGCVSVLRGKARPFS